MSDAPITERHSTIMARETTGLSRWSLLLFFFLGTSLSSYSQPQTFAPYTFTIPAGYTSTTGKSYLNFLKYNETRTAYAEITFYKTRSGTSDVNSEFIKEWDTLVKKSKHVGAPSVSAIEIENEWKSVFGSAYINVKEGNYLQTLITFASDRLVTSISIRTTGKLFAKEIEEILQSVEIAKP